MTVPRGIILDIEGTTTPISFVHDVLFSYARAHLAELLEDAGRTDVRDALSLLRTEWETERASGEPVPDWPPGGPMQAVAYVLWLMDRDRKSPALKLLQGMIWERGYADGSLRGQVYADVPRAFARWRDAGTRIAIFSSGSALAQRLIFANSDHGDLSPFIERYFDTSVGPKRSRASYERIAVEMGCAGSELLFISDVAEELEAAESAGFRIALCVRDGAGAAARTMSTITTFDAVD